MASDQKVGEAMNLVSSLEEQAAALEREATALRKLSEAASALGEDRVRAFLAPMLNGNGHHNGHVADDVPPPPEPPEDVPRGRDAIRLIVQRRPGLWSLTDLRAEMKRLGWFTSNKGIDVAVSRLAASGEARRVGKGRYEFSAPDRKEGAIESDASSAAMIAPFTFE
jgi:hypothetical protein